MRWWADPQVFTKDADYDRVTSGRSGVQSSFVPGLSITLRDERDAGDIWEETLQHKGGITEYVEYLSEGASVCSVIRLRGGGTS